MNKLEIKVGERYLTRNGDIAYVKSVGGKDQRFPFTANIETWPCPLSVTLGRNGRYAHPDHVGSEFDSSLDLVALIPSHKYSIICKAAKEAAKNLGAMNAHKPTA